MFRSFMGMFSTVLETERLVLRPFTLKDVVPSHAMQLDPEVTRYTHDGGVRTLDEIERTVRENVLGDYERVGFGRFAVEARMTGEFIGFAGLKYLPEHDLVDLGYRLRRDQWGKGLATEAGKAALDFGFNTLRLDRVHALVLPENEASVRVLEKLGMHFENEFMEDGLMAHRYVVVRQLG